MATRKGKSPFFCLKKIIKQSLKTTIFVFYLIIFWKMNKQFFQTIKHGLLMWIVALTVVCAGFYMFIKWRSTVNPWLAEQSPAGGLYVWVWETLTAAKRNVLTDKVVNAGILRVNCRKQSPTKGRYYDCNWSDVWSTWVVDLVGIYCPSWYYSVWWWGQVNGSQRIRQTNTRWINCWFISSADGIEEVEVVCIKLK